MTESLVVYASLLWINCSYKKFFKVLFVLLLWVQKKGVWKIFGNFFPDFFQYQKLNWKSKGVRGPYLYERRYCLAIYNVLILMFSTETRKEASIIRHRPCLLSSVFSIEKAIAKVTCLGKVTGVKSDNFVKYILQIHRIFDKKCGGFFYDLSIHFQKHRFKDQLPRLESKKKSHDLLMIVGQANRTIMRSSGCIFI